MTRIGIALAILLLPISVGAFELRSGDQPAVPVSEVINDDLYIAGGAVTQLGEVKGDVAAAGGNILIQGPVRGDLMIGGGSVNVLGPVTDDVRISGGNVTLNSDVGGDVIVFGGQVHISGTIKGDLITYGGTVLMDAAVSGKARIGGGDIHINGSIAENTQVQAENVTLGSGAVLAGDFEYSAVKEVVKENGAQVVGKETFTPNPDFRKAAKQGVIAFLSLWFFLKFLMLTVGALVIGLFFRKYATELGLRSLAEPVPQAVTGIVTLIVLPVISGILMVSVIGLPLGILGMLSWAALVMTGHLVAPIVLGSLLFAWILHKPIEVNWKTILVGSFVFYFIGFIPFVGWLARTFFLILTVGAMLRMKWRIAKEWR